MKAPITPMWDANDVAAYYKASRSWVYHQAEAGLIPSVRIGGFLRFDPETIKAIGRGESVGGKVIPFKTNSTGQGRF